MTASLLFILIAVGFALVFGVGGMIYDFRMRKHGLMRGTTQGQLEELHATLRAMGERLDSIDERMADQVLNGGRSDELPRGR